MAKLFVSYSRKDSAISRKIIQGLKNMGLDIWVDWEDIPPASDWLEQIFRGIEQVDVFIFLVSPDSIESEICNVEIGRAALNNKRIIPVVVRDVPQQHTSDVIRKLNWTFMREGDNFDEGIAKIKEAIEVDFDWVAEHTRLQSRALIWHRKKEPSLLLRGRDLRNTQTLVADAKNKEPKLTELQQTYILYSVRNERRNRTLLSLGILTIIIMAFLSVTAVHQSQLADKNAVEASAQRDLAQKNEKQAVLNAEQAMQAQKLAEEERNKADQARQEAVISRDLAAAQRSAARAQIYQVRPGELYVSTLLAIDSWKSIESPETEEILRENISLLPKPVRQMTHTGKINSIAFNPAGDRFVTAGDDATVCAWQVADGKNIFCADSPGAVNKAVFTPDGATVITGDNTGIALIINASDGLLKREINVGSPINDVDVQKQGNFAAFTSENGKITLIDLKTLARAGFDLKASNARLASFSPNGLQIAAGSGDGVVSIWNLNQASNNIINTRKHRGEILVLKFSPNGRYIVTGGADGAAVVTDAKTGKEIHRCLNNDQVKDIAFSPDGKWFVTVSNDRSIRVWSMDNGEQLLGMTQDNFVQAVAVSQDGRWITTTGDDKTVRVWSAFTGTQLFQIPLKGKGSALGFSRDEKYLVAGDQNGNIDVYDISSIYTPEFFYQFDGVTNSAAYSPAGKYIGVSDDKRVWLLNPNSLSTLTTHPFGNPFGTLLSNINKIIFGPNDNKLGILTSGNEVVLYNTATRSGRTVRPQDRVQAIAFSPDEKRLFAGDAAGNLQVLDSSTGGTLNTIAFGKGITTLASSSTMLAVGMEAEIHILDITSLDEIASIQAPGDHELLTFSPDGALLASATANGQVRVWKRNGAGFSDPVSYTRENTASLAFMPDNSLLAVGAVEAVYLINPDTGEEYARIPQTGTVNSVSFSPDGSKLLTSSLKVIQIWDLAKIHQIKTDNLVQAACSRLTENFSSEQWSLLFGTDPYIKLCPNLPVP